MTANLEYCHPPSRSPKPTPVWVIETLSTSTPLSTWVSNRAAAESCSAGGSQNLGWRFLSSMLDHAHSEWRPLKNGRRPTRVDHRPTTPPIRKAGQHNHSGNYSPVMTGTTPTPKRTTDNKYRPARVRRKVNKCEALHARLRVLVCPNCFCGYTLRLVNLDHSPVLDTGSGCGIRGIRSLRSLTSSHDAPVGDRRRLHDPFIVHKVTSSLWG